MSNSLYLTIPGTTDNPALTEKDYGTEGIVAGTLAMFYAGHSLYGLTAAPANNGTVSNAARVNAASVLGVDASLTDFTFLTSGISSNSIGTIELSGNKGLHVALTQSAQTADAYAALTIADAIKTYILANPSHTYFMATMARTTRAATHIQLPEVGIWNVTSPFSNYRFLGTSDASVPSSTTRAVPSIDYLGPVYRSGYSTAWTGTAPSTIANLLARQMWGNASTWAGSSWRNMAASRILDWLVFEDTTVTGRTGAAADADAYSLFQKYCGTGGKWATDTYTAPPA